MLFELAIGDAYGAGFEYAGEMVRLYNDLSHYVQHPRHTIIPGCYTDDTQMSLAIAEMILSQVEWTPLRLADKFVEAFKRDPREGYAARFYEFLLDVNSGQEFLARIHPDSDKSGAAMRAAPVGYYPDINEVIEKTTLQAALTHNTPLGIQAAIAAALMSHYFIYSLGTKSDLGQFLEKHVPGQIDWSSPYRGKVKAKGWMSVQAASTAVIGSASMSELLKTCIAFTGDVDTVAAIALAAASYSEEIAQDLPQHLIYSLENGKYGREYIMKLDAQLAALFNA